MHHDLRIYHRAHSLSVMTTARQELLEDGHRPSAGTSWTSLTIRSAGPYEGLRAGRSSGRTKPEYPAASGRRDHREQESVRRPGLGARLLATSDEARARGYIADYSAFLVIT